jgi:hypothetical protein
MQRILLAVVLAGYALAAATTTAFTGAANLVTALPIVLLAALAIALWPLRPRPRPRPLGPGLEDTRHPWRPWAVLFGAIVVWELAEYAARGSRADHPTLSSMLDAVDRYYLLKAIVFFLWLSLGAAIVRLGRQPRQANQGRQQGSRPETS